MSSTHHCIAWTSTQSYVLTIILPLRLNIFLKEHLLFQSITVACSFRQLDTSLLSCCSSYQSQCRVRGYEISSADGTQQCQYLGFTEEIINSQRGGVRVHFRLWAAARETVLKTHTETVLFHGTAAEARKSSVTLPVWIHLL